MERCRNYCALHIGHKVATAICVTLALGTSIYVYYYFASLAEEKGLLGVAPWIYGYLRYSSIVFFGIALLTYALTFFNLKATRAILIAAAALVIANLSFALICYFAWKKLLINSYKPLFAKAEYVDIAAACEKSEQCCGWSNEQLVHTQGCEWAVTCDVVMRQQMGGVNMVAFGIGISGALALMIYVLVAHIMLLDTNKDPHTHSRPRTRLANQPYFPDQYLPCHLSHRMALIHHLTITCT